MHSVFIFVLKTNIAEIITQNMTEILTQKSFVKATSPWLNNWYRGWSGEKINHMALSLYIMSIDHQYLPLKIPEFCFDFRFEFNFEFHFEFCFEFVINFALNFVLNFVLKTDWQIDRLTDDWLVEATCLRLKILTIFWFADY